MGGCSTKVVDGGGALTEIEILDLQRLGVSMDDIMIMFKCFKCQSDKFRNLNPPV